MLALDELLESIHVAQANYKLQADHAAFGGIALPLVFGPHVG